MKSILAVSQNATSLRVFKPATAAKTVTTVGILELLSWGQYLEAGIARLVNVETRFGTNFAQPKFEASHLISWLGSSGKVHQFSVYFNRDLFDTPENRVITSGLIFGFCLTSVGITQSHHEGPEKTSQQM